MYIIGTDDNVTSFDWTIEAPKEAGWYWVSYIYGSGKRYQRIIYIDDNQTYYAPKDWDDENREHIRELGHDVYWLGAVPEPSAPSQQELAHKLMEQYGINWTEHLPKK